MTLEFSLVLIAGLLTFGVAYFAFRIEKHKLRTLMSKFRSRQHRSGEKSILTLWIFQGRGIRADRVARLFTVFPPFMLIVSVFGIAFTFVVAIAFLKVAESVGLLVGALLLAFPFYRAADSFDMLLLSRVARRIEFERFGKDDEALLRDAQAALAKGTNYFRKLFGLTVAAMPVAVGSLIIGDSWYAVLPLAVLAFVILVSTITTYGLRFQMRPTESEDTREIAPPMAGDHLSYGAVWHLNATRERLMRKFRYEHPPEQDATNEEG